MATLLAVETSGSLCSLAIHVADRWFEDTQNVERLHNRVVLGCLDALVRRAGVDRRAFDCVAFGAGPGSFTGIRIAAAVAQGVAFGCGARVIPVSSSEALALALGRHGEHGGSRHRVMTVTRSRRDAFYLAEYRLPDDGFPQRLSGDRLHQGEEPPSGLSAALVGVGDRPDWWPADREFVDGVATTARCVGELGLAAANAGKALPPAAALPIYVSGDSPWRPAGG